MLDADRLTRIHGNRFALPKLAVSATMRAGQSQTVRATGMLMILLALCPAASAQPQFRNAGATLIGEQVTNKVIHSGERVTVGLALKNVGNAAASNLVATIQQGNGVFNPVPLSADYGALAPWAPSVAREFTFTATAPSNSLFNVKLDLADSGRDLGSVTFRFRIGPQTTSVTNSDHILIPPVGPPPTNHYPSILSVTGMVGTIVGVSVTLSNLSHSYPDDLDILLVSPNEDAVMLMSDALGNGHRAFTDQTIIFSDDAQTTLPDINSLPLAEVNRPVNYPPPDTMPEPAPEGPYAGVLSAFNGKLANGDWKLFIMDDQQDDQGELQGGWSISITTLHPIDEAPLLTLIGRSTNHIVFSVSGHPWHTYAIETGPDPVQSFPLEIFVMPAGGVREFQYPLESTDRFFRAVTEP